MNRSKFNNPETIEGLSRPILNFDGLLKNSLEMLRHAQHERKNISDSKLRVVRPELGRRANGVLQKPVEP